MIDLKPTFAKAYPDGFLGGQCGVFAHNLVLFPPVGNSLAEKIMAVKLYGVTAAVLNGQFRPGDVVIFDVGTAEGHVAVVNCIIDNHLRMTESNWHLDERVHHDRLVPIDSQTIIGVLRGPLKLKILPMIDFKVLIICNNHTSPNLAIQQQEIHDKALNWSSGKLNIVSTVINSNLTPVYSSLGTIQDPSQPGSVPIDTRCIDQAWFDQNVLPLVPTGYDAVLFWVDSNDWQGTIQALMMGGTPIAIQQNVQNPSIETMLTPDMYHAAKISLHELAHGFYLIANQTDQTHHYDYSDPLGLAGAYQNIVWDWVAQNLTLRRAQQPLQGEPMIIIHKKSDPNTKFALTSDVKNGFVDITAYNKQTAGRSIVDIALDDVEFDKIPTGANFKS